MKTSFETVQDGMSKGLVIRKYEIQSCENIGSTLKSLVESLFFGVDHNVVVVNDQAVVIDGINFDVFCDGDSVDPAYTLLEAY